MKPADVNSSTYIEFNKENNKEGPKFKVGDHVRTSKYKIFLRKVMFQIGQTNSLWLKKLKILSRHVLLVILKDIVGTEKSKLKRANSWKSNKKKKR